METHAGLFGEDLHSPEFEGCSDECTQDTAGLVDTVGLGETGPQRTFNNSILVSLDGLKLSGTSYLEALQLAFQVACLRCTQTKEEIFSASSVSEAISQQCTYISSSGTCTKCSQDMCLTIFPHIVHVNSNTLAHMRAEGCSPVDLLPSCFGAQCESCGALAAMRQVQVCSDDVIQIIMFDHHADMLLVL